MTTALELAVWAADQPPDMIVGPDAVEQAQGYFMRRLLERLEKATEAWRESLSSGRTQDRLDAWRLLVDAREDYEQTLEESA